MNIWQKIKHWWDGDTKPYDIPGVIGFHTEWHWTANAVRYAWDFYLRNWQWIIGTIITIILGVIAL